MGEQESLLGSLDLHDAQALSTAMLHHHTNPSTPTSTMQTILYLHQFISLHSSTWRYIAEPHIVELCYHSRTSARRKATNNDEYPGGDCRRPQCGSQRDTRSIV